jgi:hypothetical protein
MFIFFETKTKGLAAKVLHSEKQFDLLKSWMHNFEDKFCP